MTLVKSITKVSAKTLELKRRIERTFSLSCIQDFEGLTDRLNSIGHQSTAYALTQLIEANVTLDPADTDKKDAISGGLKDFPVAKKNHHLEPPHKGPGQNSCRGPDNPERRSSPNKII